MALGLLLATIVHHDKKGSQGLYDFLGDIKKAKSGGRIDKTVTFFRVESISVNISTKKLNF